MTHVRDVDFETASDFLRVLVKINFQAEEGRPPTWFSARIASIEK